MAKGLSVLGEIFSDTSVLLCHDFMTMDDLLLFSDRLETELTYVRISVPISCPQ